MHQVRTELNQDLGHLQREAELQSIRVNESSVGVGYSGPGFETILEVSRMILDDVGRLAALGGWILWLKERASRKHKRMTVISDAPTMGAVAAASVTASLLVGYRFVLAQPATGWPEYPDETDERFVWVATFEHDERHEVLAVFMSQRESCLATSSCPCTLTWITTAYSSARLRNWRKCSGFVMVQRRKSRPAAIELPCLSQAHPTGLASSWKPLGTADALRAWVNCSRQRAAAARHFAACRAHSSANEVMMHSWH